ncbi:DNA repair protein RadC [Prolixibacter sp. SD074]|jgi:DNA repair protein RadC|uniref:RadC family protein n=1 Tax=Prolixibacter sp. SD074 TaxID=2652391 RepID=UPI00127FFAEC|nr:DNA repair protein RadC [Prolixibacter sp. SD074]GET30694.1 DNA repair protein RadC [Prolixibacter sp. SD074]
MEEYRKLSIKDWAVEDRPREKLLYRGIASLSDAELIAILIGSGNNEETAVELSRRILGTVKNNLNALGKLDVEALKKFKGIGEAKAIAVIAALELGRRRNQSGALKMQQITSSRDAANFLQPVMGDLPHEEFWVLHLNRHNKIIHYERISQGGLTGTVIDVRVILKKALEKLATSIIIAHNHPSGNLQASDSDRKITTQLRDAAKLMEIPLLDHLIITQTGYYSFADDGIL